MMRWIPTHGATSPLCGTPALSSILLPSSSSSFRLDTSRMTDFPNRADLLNERTRLLEKEGVDTKTGRVYPTDVIRRLAQIDEQLHARDMGASSSFPKDYHTPTNYPRTQDIASTERSGIGYRDPGPTTFYSVPKEQQERVLPEFASRRVYPTGYEEEEARERAARQAAHAYQPVRDLGSSGVHRRIDRPSELPRTLENIQLQPYSPPAFVHPDWKGHPNQQAAENFFYQTQAVSQTTGGVSPNLAAARLPQHNAAIRSGEIPLQMVTQLEQLWARSQSGRMSQAQFEQQARNLPGQSPAMMATEASLAHLPGAEQTRALRLQQLAASRPTVQNWYRYTARNMLGSSYISEPRSTGERQVQRYQLESAEQKLRSVLSNLSDEQINAVLSRGATVLTAGPGTGKTETAFAHLLDHIFNEKLDPRDVVVLSRTHSALNAIYDRVEKAVKAGILPQWDQKQFRTIESYMLSQLYRGKMSGNSAMDKMNMGTMELLGVGNATDVQKKFANSNMGAIEAAMQQYRASQEAFIRETQGKYGLVPRGQTSPGQLMQKIAAVKGNMLSSQGNNEYQALMARGEQLYRAGERNDPAVHLWAYEQNLAAKRKYDLSNVPGFYEKAASSGYIAPTKAMIVSEFQNMLPDQARALKAGMAPGRGRMAFFEGDMGQKGIPHPYRIDQMLPDISGSGTRSYSLHGNYRLSHWGASLNRAVNQGTAIQSVGASPLPVSMRNDVGLPPKLVYRPTFNDLNLTAVAQLFRQIGRTRTQMGANVQAGLHPFAGGKLAEPQDLALIWQMHDERMGRKGQQGFIDALKWKLEEKLGPQLAENIFQQGFSTETPSATTRGKISLLLTQQSQSRSFQDVMGFVTRVGQWDQAGYETNLNIMTSRAMGRTTLLGAGQNLGQRSYNNAPDFWEAMGIPIPHGAGNLLPRIAESMVTAHGHTGTMPYGWQSVLPNRTSATGMDARSLASSWQQGNPQAMQAFIESSLALMPFYRGAVGDDSALSGNLEQIGFDYNKESGKAILPDGFQEQKDLVTLARKGEKVDMGHVALASQFAQAILANGPGFVGATPFGSAHGIPENIGQYMELVKQRGDTRALKPLPLQVSDPKKMRASTMIGGRWGTGAIYLPGQESPTDTIIQEHDMPWKEWGIIEDDPYTGLNRGRYQAILDRIGDRKRDEGDREDARNAITMLLKNKDALRLSPQLNILMQEMMSSADVARGLRRQARRYGDTGYDRMLSMAQNNMGGWNAEWDGDNLKVPFSERVQQLEIQHEQVEQLRTQLEDLRQNLDPEELTARQRILEKAEKVYAENRQSINDPRQYGVNRVGQAVHRVLTDPGNEHRAAYEAFANHYAAWRIASGNLLPDRVRMLHESAIQLAVHPELGKGQQGYFTHIAQTLGATAGAFDIDGESAQIAPDEAMLQHLWRTNPREAALVSKLLRNKQGEFIPVEEAFGKTQAAQAFDIDRMVNSPELAARLGTTLAASHTAPHVTEMRVLADLLDRPGSGVLDPQAGRTIFDSQGHERFISEGIGVTLSGLEQRMYETANAPNVAHSDVSPAILEKMKPQEIRAMDARIRHQIREHRANLHHFTRAIKDPGNQEQWGHAMAAVQQMVTGTLPRDNSGWQNSKHTEEEIKAHYAQRGLDQFWAPIHSLFKEGNRTLPRMQDLYRQIGDITNRMQAKGTIRRGDVDKLLGLMGHDPEGAQHRGLRALEKSHGFMGDDATMTLQQLAAAFHDPEQKNSPSKNTFMTMTRFPLKPGQRVTFMGGAEGFPGRVTGERRNKQGQLLPNQQELDTGMSGTVEAWNPNTFFGASVNLGIHRALGMIPDKKTFGQLGHVKDMPYEPLLQFRSDKNGFTYPVLHSQLVPEGHPLVERLLGVGSLAQQPAQVGGMSGWNNWIAQVLGNIPEQQNAGAVAQATSPISGFLSAGSPLRLPQHAASLQAVRLAHLNRKIGAIMRRGGTRSMGKGMIAAPAALRERVSQAVRFAMAARPPDPLLMRANRTPLASSVRFAPDADYQPPHNLADYQRLRGGMHAKDTLKLPVVSYPEHSIGQVFLFGQRAQLAKGGMQSYEEVVQNELGKMQRLAESHPHYQRYVDELQHELAILHTSPADLQYNALTDDMKGATLPPGIAAAISPSSPHSYFSSLPTQQLAGIASFSSSSHPLLLPEKAASLFRGWGARPPLATPDVIHMGDPAGVHSLPVPPPPDVPDAAHIPSPDVAVSPIAQQLEDIGHALQFGNEKLGIQKPDSDQLAAMLGQGTQGHRLIVGGPGTGKTDVLVNSLLNEITSGHVRPEEIISLSAMNSGKTELSNRTAVVNKLLPAQVGKIAEARTFHALGRDIMNEGMIPEMDEDHPAEYPAFEEAGYHGYTGDILWDPTVEDMIALGHTTPAAQKSYLAKVGMRQFATKHLTEFIAEQKRLSGSSALRPPGAKEISDILEHSERIKSNRTDDPNDLYSQHMATGRTALSEMRAAPGTRKLTKDAGLALLDEMQHREAKPDYNDVLYHAGARVKRLGVHALPEYAARAKLLAVDEFQDSRHVVLQMLGNMMGALSHNKPRLFLSGDMQQTVIPTAFGAIGPNQVTPAYLAMLARSSTAGVSRHDLSINHRSDMGAVYWNNSIRGQKALANETLSAEQRPDTEELGTYPQFLMARTQPQQYQEMFRESMRRIGVSFQTIGENVAAGRHPFAGVEWQKTPGGRPILPSEVKTTLSRTKDIALYLRAASEVLQQELGYSQPQADKIAAQIHRSSVSREQVGPTGDVPAELMQFPLTKHAGVRSFSTLFEHLDATMLGKYDREKPGGMPSELETAFGRLDLIGHSRVAKGGQVTFAATQYPLTSRQIDEYLKPDAHFIPGGGTFAIDGGAPPTLNGKVIQPSKENKFEVVAGKYVPAGFVSLIKDQAIRLLKHGVSPDGPYFPKWLHPLVKQIAAQQGSSLPRHPEAVSVNTPPPPPQGGLPDLDPGKLRLVHMTYQKNIEGIRKEGLRLSGLGVLGHTVPYGSAEAAAEAISNVNDPYFKVGNPHAAVFDVTPEQFMQLRQKKEGILPKDLLTGIIPATPGTGPEQHLTYAMHPDILREGSQTEVMAHLGLGRNISPQKPGGDEPFPKEQWGLPPGVEDGSQTLEEARATLQQRDRLTRASSKPLSSQLYFLRPSPTGGPVPLADTYGIRPPAQTLMHAPLSPQVLQPKQVTINVPNGATVQMNIQQGAMGSGTGAHGTTPPGVRPGSIGAPPPPPAGNIVPPAAPPSGGGTAYPGAGSRQPGAGSVFRGYYSPPARSSSGGSGPSGGPTVVDSEPPDKNGNFNPYNNPTLFIARELGRIGSELSYVGASATDHVNAALQQGSDYRHATMQIFSQAAPPNPLAGTSFAAAGVPMQNAMGTYYLGGATGDTGPFQFTDPNSNISMIQNQIPMYSKAQVATGIQNYLASSGQYYNAGSANSSVDVMGLAAMSNMNPADVTAAVTGITGYTNARMQAQTGQAIPGYQNQQTSQLIGMLTRATGGNFTQGNVAPYLTAMQELMPSFTGNSYGSTDSYSAMTSAGTFLQLALNSGQNPANLPQVGQLGAQMAQMGQSPDLRQQYMLAKLYGEQNLTASPQYFQYKYGQTQLTQQIQQMQLGSNLFAPGTGIYQGAQADLAGTGLQGLLGSQGKGLSVQQLQINADTTQIESDKVNFAAASLSLAQGYATFNQQQYQQTQLLGPIGETAAQTGRSAYFNFQNRQMAAGYNPLNADTASTFQPKGPVFGLKNEEFYAGVENQRSMLVLGRSRLTSDAAFQQQMKYLNQQENFYVRELALQNQQREFDKTWSLKDLDMQGRQLAVQGKQLAQQVLQLEFDKANQKIQAANWNTMLGELKLIQQNTIQSMQGQGPIGGRNITPMQLIQQLVAAQKGGKDIHALLQGAGLSPDQIAILQPMISTASKGNLTAMQEQSMIAGDKNLQALLQMMIQSGAFGSQEQQAGQADAGLASGGTQQQWKDLIESTRSLYQTNQALNGTLSGLTPFLQAFGVASKYAGPIAQGLAGLEHLIGIVTAGGGGGGAGGGSSGGGQGGPIPVVPPLLNSLPSSNNSGMLGPLPTSSGLPGDQSIMKFWLKFLEDLQSKSVQGQKDPKYPHYGILSPHVNAEFHQKMSYGVHQGVDLQAGQGSPFSEFVGGRVIYAGWQPWGGEVDVSIAGGMHERYLHLSQIGVHPGQTVGRGQRIGLTGGGTPQSGLGKWSSGSHLHVQYDWGDINKGVDPWVVWAALGDKNLTSFISAPFAMQNYMGHIPSGLQPVHHLSQGGVAMSPILSTIGEQAPAIPEVVLPISKLQQVLDNYKKSGTVSGSGETGVQAATKSTTVNVQHLVGTLNLTVQGAGGGAMSDEAQDVLMEQVLTTLSQALAQIENR